MGDLVMNDFFNFGVHLQWPGLAQKRQILDRRWPNMTGFSMFQCCSKKFKTVNLTMKLWKMSEKGQNSIKNRTFFPKFSCHGWQFMGLRELIYSYLVPEMIVESFVKIGLWNVSEPSYLPLL